MKARPFLKWAGGKRQLLPELLSRVPPTYDRYIEPFVGGGALFFELTPHRAILADINTRLIRTYRAVRDDVEHIIDGLSDLPFDREEFENMRALDVDAQDDADVAVWLIYLNRTCFNGLYRVNRAGKFNTPFGQHRNPTICDAENLRAVSDLLQVATAKSTVSAADPRLRSSSWTETLERAREGDFVYADPPYVPVSASSNFTSYASGGFARADQEELRDRLLVLKRRGVRVLASNSIGALDLYSIDGFKVEKIAARRNINSKGGGRGDVVELLIS